MFSVPCKGAPSISRPGALAMPLAGTAALMRALADRDDDGAMRLLSAWPRHDQTLPQFRTAIGETLLHVAAYWRSSPEVLRMLLARGVELRGVTRTGASPLHYAMQGVMRASPAALQWLLREGGPTLREGADANGRTALMAAVLSDAAEAVTTLVDAGAAVRARDDGGRTALHFAAAVGSPALLDALLAAGADADARDKSGVTPLMMATAQGRLDNVLRLLVADVDIDAADGQGGTPLMYAVANGHVELADVLLTSGAAWHHANDGGWNALTLAAYTGHGGMLQLLLEHGANPVLPDGAGRLAWQVAVQRGAADLEIALRVPGSGTGGGHAARAGLR
ncbi:ankyrin repeat domain-containing protein [Cupriavidus gilardii]|uniref:ankyrin repeat domain-containing protein n=1 Tax=Cupriavidus gilardii TaxID=82541 RepID=UPI001ABDA109|nr:ankyrin repeat domain-containing protein [Cupriavidus gilardii]MBO4119507.1 ankyrin repeat domain-containing protein [Cupriavidus gilardii]